MRVKGYQIQVEVIVRSNKGEEGGRGKDIGKEKWEKIQSKRREKETSPPGGRGRPPKKKKTT